MTQSSNLKDLEQLIRSKLPEQVTSLKGVDDASLNAFERSLGLQLPSYYRNFLATLGQSTQQFSPWISLDFAELKYTQDHFRMLTATKGLDIKLPANALIIGSWQSVFDYIICDGVEDPAVFRVDVLQPESIAIGRRYPSCSSYLKSLVQNCDPSHFCYDFFAQTGDTNTALH